MRKQNLDDEILGRAFDSKLAKKSFAFCVPYKKEFILVLITMIATAGTNLMAPLIFKYAIDNGIKNNSIRVLSISAVIYLVVYILRWFFQYYQSVLTASLAMSVTNNIRRTLYSHLQKLSLSFFDNYEVGRIISRMIGDVDAVNALIVSGALTLVVDIMTAIGVIAIMLSMNTRLTLATMALVPVIFFVTLLFRTKARLAYRDVRKKVAIATATLAENVSGVRVVKSFSREKSNLLKYKRINREYRRSFMHAVIVGSVFTSVIEFMTILGVVVIYIYGGSQIKIQALTIGAFYAFLHYVNLFFTPVRSMSMFYTTMQAAMAGAERIFEILETKPDVMDRDDAVELHAIKGKVEFCDVTFAYDEIPILKNVSFNVEPGKTIALVGSTGAGKSTIVNLLARQYDVTQGAIMIDGTDIRSITMNSLRKQMGVVLQDSFLFPGTIRENLRYGRLDATDFEVQQAAQIVGIHEFIISMPKGYKTDVQEGASNFSTGQKQLLSFARALLADPRILILDEATSSVDTKTELLIQEALRQLFKNRTSFVVAHRLSTISEADTIMVVSDGEIVESGSHGQLLKISDGVYRRLYELQFKDQTK